jgi:hypothetical protein
MGYLGLTHFWKNEQQKTGEEERRKEVKGKKKEFRETAENILQSSPRYMCVCFIRNVYEVRVSKLEAGGRAS